MNREEDSLSFFLPRCDDPLFFFPKGGVLSLKKRYLFGYSG